MDPIEESPPISEPSSADYSKTNPELFNAIYGMPQTIPTANDAVLNQGIQSSLNPNTPLPIEDSNTNFSDMSKDLDKLQANPSAAGVTPSAAGATPSSNNSFMKSFSSGLNRGLASNVVPSVQNSNSFTAVFGVGKSTNIPPPQSFTLPQVSIAQPAPLGTVAAGNTAITQFGQSTAAQPVSTISDKRAKTNIKSASKQVYDFLNYLNKGKNNG